MVLGVAFRGGSPGRRGEFYRRSIDDLPGTYVKDERARIPGVIRNRDYDTAVVGASSAWAVRPADVAAILGGKAAILVVSGGTAAEEGLVAAAAAAQGRAKRIVWLLDSVVFNYAGMRPDAQMPTYLYRPGVVSR